MNIILTGFMACGKSTVGKVISELCNMQYIDTDDFIEKKKNMKISDIFANFGEEYFRQLETNAAKELSETENAVVSTGGGFVINKENIDILRKNGQIVYLNTDFEIIMNRLKNNAGGRPLAKDEKHLADLYKIRKPLYLNCDIKIDITEEVNAEETAKKIIKLTGGKI